MAAWRARRQAIDWMADQLDCPRGAASGSDERRKTLRGFKTMKTPPARWAGDVRVRPNKV